MAHKTIEEPKKQVIGLYQAVLELIRKRLSRVQYIILTAVIVGGVSGLMAVLLKTSVHHVHSWVNSFSERRLLFLFFPAAGLLLTTWVIHRFFKGHIEKGIAMVLKSIARRHANIPSRNNYVHFITSALTVGFGGSAGLEAPIVATGSSLGSTMGRLGKLPYADRILMVTCGAAAGIAAVYNAPIAGVIFAIEVLLIDTVVSYFVPLIISAVIGVLCSKVLVGDANMFNFNLKENFNYHNVPFYILFGVISGFIALYYARMFRMVDKAIHAWTLNRYTKALAGGTLLAMCFLLFPPLYGEGYLSMMPLANGRPEDIVPDASWMGNIPANVLLLFFFALVFLLKPIAAAITIGSGGNGGNFAPSLFVGAFWGFFFSRLLNVTGWVHLPESNFTLVGMAALLSGVMYCPLTAIFLIAEITNGYGLFIPLMIVSSISYFVVKQFEPFYMEIKEMALGGQIFTHKKEHNILASLHIPDLLQHPERKLHINDKFEAIMELIRHPDHNNFAVVDDDGILHGVIDLNDIRIMLSKPADYLNTTVKQYIHAPADIVYDTESVVEIMKKFDTSQASYLPVVKENKEFAGFIYKSYLFDLYRERLSLQKDIYEE
jgi:CIC family chloride channel protein